MVCSILLLDNIAKEIYGEEKKKGSTEQELRGPQMPNQGNFTYFEKF